MDFSGVTEARGDYISREALSMLYTRYRYVAGFCEEKDVLEVACGAGGGLGYVAKTARMVIGGDYTEALVRSARQYYVRRIPLLRLDAQLLPFRASSFDVVLLCEAIYYLPEPDRFIEECHRVLREKGTLVISTVNKEWSDFNPSPFSTKYFSLRELSDLFKTHEFDAEFFGAFSATPKSAKTLVVSWIKRLAVRLHLIPRTMKGKESLKRLFFGPLFPVPPEVYEGLAPYASPLPISDTAAPTSFKVLFAVARPS